MFAVCVYFAMKSENFRLKTAGYGPEFDESENGDYEFKD